MRRTTSTQEVRHVTEEFDMAPLIGAHRDPVHIFLDRGGDDLVHRTVVAQMHHLDAHRLENPSHDIDRCVVAIKQRRRSDKSQPAWRPGFGCRLVIGLRIDWGLKRHLYYSCMR